MSGAVVSVLGTRFNTSELEQLLEASNATIAGFMLHPVMRTPAEQCSRAEVLARAEAFAEFRRGYQRAHKILSAVRR